jgi:3' terminal RNA ribose 2'-O-methyltransferase Hen1
VAIAQVYSTALNGTCKTRPELAAAPIPLEAHLPVLPAKGGGEELLRRLFEPLGYTVTVKCHPLDSHFPDWGDSRYYSLTLSGTVRLADLLTHLYVLIPVLDEQKHYYVGNDEIDKLLKRGEGWLAAHPERALITRRYLKHQQSLINEAMMRLTEDEADPDETENEHDQEEESIEKSISLHEQRLEAVAAALIASGAQRVLDLGCGEGRLIERLLKERQFAQIVGVDVSHRALEKASRQLKLDRLPPMQRARVNLMQGALTYRDDRLNGYDAAALVEVIEHLDMPRLAAMERAILEFARPATVVITTPNVEYNVRFETLPAGKLRHRDHRFEWTRVEFQEWAEAVAKRFRYSVTFAAIGPEDAEVGAPSQMAVFAQLESQ